MISADEYDAPVGYVKRPVQIEAIHYHGSFMQHIDIVHWMRTGEYVQSEPLIDPTSMSAHLQLPVETLEGTVFADPGDWIIRGVEGEFYPCKDSVFRKTYDRVGG